MGPDDISEAVAILTRMLTVLLGALQSSTGRGGSALRYAVGDLQATAQKAIGTAALGAPLVRCFGLAWRAGATPEDIDAVRLAMQAETTAGLAGVIVTNLGIRLALATESLILTTTTFTSSQDVFAVLDRTGAAFDAAEEYAADNRDAANYQALIGLRAATVRDLTIRAAMLPRRTTYTLPRGTTSHVLANRLYGDARRADELRAENKIIHPAFMPASGSALSE